MSSHVETLKEKFTVSVEGRPSLCSILSCLNENVSNEGILTEWYGDVMRNRKYGKKPDMKEINRSNFQLAKVVKQFYRNEAWLSKRRFIEGEVSLGENVSALVIDYKIATPEQIQENIDYLATWIKKVLAVAEEEAKQIKDVGSKLKSAPIDDETLTRFQAAVGDITNAEETISNMLDRDFTLPMGYRIHNGFFSEPQRQTQIKKVQALTPEQVSVVADLLLKITIQAEDFQNALDKLYGVDDASFARDPQWRGYKVINTYAKGIDTRSIDQEIDFGNNTANAIYGIGKGLVKNAAVAQEVNNRQRYAAWKSILERFKGNEPHSARSLYYVHSDIQFALASWIDVSIR